jgi:hypothetical protein
MALIAPRVTAGLPAEDAQKLKYALNGSHDITVWPRSSPASHTPICGT